MSRRKCGDRDENTLLELRAINGGNGPKRNGKHIAAKGMNMGTTHGFGEKTESGLGATAVPLDESPGL